MRPHADGMTGETREMQELRRLPKNLFLLDESKGLNDRRPFFINKRCGTVGTSIFSNVAAYMLESHHNSTVACVQTADASCLLNFYFLKLYHLRNCFT